MSIVLSSVCYYNYFTSIKIKVENVKNKNKSMGFVWTCDKLI